VGIVTLFPPRAASLRPDSALLELSLRLSASEVNLRSLRRISWCGRAALRVGQPISQPGYREASRRGDECGLRGEGCQTRSLALWPSSSCPMKCPKSRKLYAVFQRGAKLCPLLITQTSAPSMKIDDQHGQGFIAMEFLNGLTRCNIALPSVRGNGIDSLARNRDCPCLRCFTCQRKYYGAFQNHFLGR
jgi:hypothetical protein